MTEKSEERMTLRYKEFRNSIEGDLYLLEMRIKFHEYYGFPKSLKILSLYLEEELI